MLVPKFLPVWNAFPTHGKYQTMGDLYRHLGGGAQAAIDWDGFTETGNTCASRISVALNGGGSPISPLIAQKLGLLTLKTAAADHILVRVKELRAYLRFVYGTPDVDQTAPFLDKVKGKRGIVAFTVTGWSDATGHVALYDGSDFKEPDHDDVPEIYPEVTVVQTEFWELR